MLRAKLLALESLIRVQAPVRVTEVRAEPWGDRVVITAYEKRFELQYFPPFSFIFFFVLGQEPCKHGKLCVPVAPVAQRYLVTL